MSARKEVVCEERAQATVELAVVAPVLVVLALVSYNMMVFVSATARFDRVAPDIVLAHGSSPPASEPDTAAETWGVADAVAGELERAMEGYEVEIEVEVSEGGQGALRTLSGARACRPAERRYLRDAIPTVASGVVDCGCRTRCAAVHGA